MRACEFARGSPGREWPCEKKKLPSLAPSPLRPSLSLLTAVPRFLPSLSSPPSLSPHRRIGLASSPGRRVVASGPRKWGSRRACSSLRFSSKIVEIERERLPLFFLHTEKASSPAAMRERSELATERKQRRSEEEELASRRCERMREKRKWFVCTALFFVCRAGKKSGARERESRERRKKGFGALCLFTLSLDVP